MLSKHSGKCRAVLTRLMDGILGMKNGGYHVIGELVLEATKSLLVIETRGCTDVVVGVPHHAPAGVEQLPCPEHKDADENAGFLGRYLAELLDACSVIACNYPIDVNKRLSTDYCTQIVGWSPQVLVEIHGHGSGRARSDIEISSGADNNVYSETLVSQLRAKLSAIKGLDSYSICGTHSKLGLAARAAVTVNDERWLTYHVELPRALRIPSGTGTGEPPGAGYQFCDALAEVLTEIHREGRCQNANDGTA